MVIRISATIIVSRLYLHDSLFRILRIRKKHESYVLSMIE